MRKKIGSGCLKAELKKCPVCGAEIASNAKACPSCGAKQKRPFYKKWWFWVVIVLLIGSAGGGGTGNGAKTESGSVSSVQRETQTEMPAPEPEPKAEKYEIIGDVVMERDMFSTTLTGVLKNNSGRDYNYLQISFNMYDADGNLIDTAFDNINNLSDGGTWKFKAIGLSSDNAASWELEDITGW